MEKWLKLQNGSDIRGIALDGVAGETVNLSHEEAAFIGYAFTIWLKNKSAQETVTIAVGHDSRVSAQTLKSAFISGIQAAGGKALDCGLSTTPSLFMSTIFEDVRATGGVMITASHLPFNRNGFKFFTPAGGLDKPDIKAILELCSEASTQAIQINLVDEASVPNCPLIKLYSAYLVQMIRTRINHPTHFETPLSGFKIIVDAGNGAGGFFAEQVLKPLGADTAGSQFLEPDGMFPNHPPNPEDSAAMTAIMEATIASHADLGIIFDTDVDRSAVVLADGSEINRNQLIALMSAIVLKEHPGTTIVTDSVTSEGLAHFISNIGGKHLRFKRGYKNVINESMRLNNLGISSELAIETSGHGALKENYFLDDGAYMAVKILIEMASLKLADKTLADLVKPLHQPVESEEIRIKIKPEDFKSIGDKIIKDLETNLSEFPDWVIASDNYEGIRIQCNAPKEQGWFLLRMSLHDPVMPLNIESNLVGGVKEIALKIYSILNSHEDLDLTGFDRLILKK